MLNKAHYYFDIKPSIKSCGYLLLICFLCFTQFCFAQPNKHAAPWVGESLAGAPCNGHLQGYGPYDYLNRGSLPFELSIVERRHFNKEIQDLDYTLRAWPNHHKALYATVRNRIEGWNYKKPTLSTSTSTPAECYLQRAINFSPEDGTTMMLYAMLLHQTKHTSLALTQYRSALEAEPNNAQVQYNLSLLLVELGKFNEANQYAQELYARGYPLPGLKNKLIRAGQWQNTAKHKSSNDESSARVSEVQQ